MAQALGTRRCAFTSCKTFANTRVTRPIRRCHMIVRAQQPSIDELNEKFRIGDAGRYAVEVAAGKGDLPKVTLRHATGTTAEVYLWGANVVSFKQTSDDEVLYVRPDAVFDGKKPISGGIPICFPQFGPGPMQQHGFARNLNWEIASTSADFNPDERDPEVELVLSDNEVTRGMWPYKFKAVYTVRLHGDKLQTDFRVVNEDDKPFEFTAALHTYIEVVHVSKAVVTGLQGLEYLDKSVDPKNPARKTEQREGVTFGDALVDSVYLNAPEHVELDVGSGAAVSMDATGWEDVVVWNPHKTMESCYQEFVCVENAKTGTPVNVQPGESWRATTEFVVVDI